MRAVSAASEPDAAIDGASGSPADRGARPSIEPGEGTRMGRYMVLRRIGAGASGVVFAAYDPELDRKVALKVLVSTTDDHVEGSRRDRRLLREAQALARVHHPHVVRVHDVGVWNEQVFLAMDFCNGGTLRQWLAAAPRSWREVVARFREAGLGLAAAHDAGLVHRDFKPDNVLLHDDGRAVVTDFGLARAVAMPPDEAIATGAIPVMARLGGLEATGPDARGSAPEITLTATGAIAGTPAYMAPELFEGGVADARSDQFAFCVALFEALFGTRPFRGATIGALVAALDRGPVTPDGARSVPRWLRGACVRGLARAPGERHGDLHGVVAALGGPPPWRPRNAAIGVAGAAFVGLYLVRASPEARASYCDDVEAKLDGAWDDTARTRLAERFAATGLPFADASAQRVTTALDTFAQEWIEAQRATCRASTEEPAAIAARDATTACLARQQASFSALARTLVSADADTVMRSAEAVAHLPRVTDCASAKPGELPPPDEAERAAVARARELIQDAISLRIVGKAEPSVTAAREALAVAETTTYAPVVAEAKVELASSLTFAGHTAESETLNHTALSEALACDHGSVVAKAASELAFIEINRMAAPELIEQWARTGLAALESHPTQDVDLRAQLTDFLGVGQRRAGRLEEANATLREVLAMREAHWGHDHYTVAQSLSSLGMVAARSGDLDEAVAYIERARQIFRDTYGEHHPHYGAMVQNLATTYLVSGDYRAALALYQEGSRLLGDALGPRHPSVAVLASNVATTLLMLERFDEAIAIVDEEESIDGPLHGSESLQAATRRALIGEIALRAGRFGEAEVAIRDAIAITQRVAPTDARRLANYRSQLGWALALAERYDEARALLEPTLREQAEIVGDPSVEIAETSGRLAMVELAQGRLAEARRLIDISVKQYASEDPDPHELAVAWHRRAEVLWAQGEHEAAREEARRAIAFHREHDEQPSRRAAVEAWLASVDAK